MFFTYKNGIGTKVEAYVIGKPNAVQSILDGVQDLTDQGLNSSEGHRMLGEGVGYTQPEIDEFVGDIDQNGSEVYEETEGFFKAEDI